MILLTFYESLVAMLRIGEKCKSREINYKPTRRNQVRRDGQSGNKWRREKFLILGIVNIDSREFPSSVIKTISLITQGAWHS